MAACLPFLLPPNLLLILLLLFTTLGVGGPSFHSLFGRDDVVPASTATRIYIERGLGRPLKPVDTFPLGLSGPPRNGLFGDSIGTSTFLARRTRSSPPHIDPYYRCIFQPTNYNYRQKQPLIIVHSVSIHLFECRFLTNQNQEQAIETIAC